MNTPANGDARPLADSAGGRDRVGLSAGREDRTAHFPVRRFAELFESRRSCTTASEPYPPFAGVAHPRCRRGRQRYPACPESLSRVTESSPGAARGRDDQGGNIRSQLLQFPRRSVGDVGTEAVPDQDRPAPLSPPHLGGARLHYLAETIHEQFRHLRRNDPGNEPSVPMVATRAATAAVHRRMTRHLETRPRRDSRRPSLLRSSGWS